MAALAGVDQQFTMLRGAMRDKIFEYIGRKQSSAEWRKRLPELAKRLEEILYRKFPNKNEYYNMMKGPFEPQLQFAIKTLSAQNQQNQQNSQISRQIASSSGYGTMIPTPGMIPQNPQMARETASSSGAMIPDLNHADPCEQSASASLPPDVQNNNADEPDRTDTVKIRQ